MEKWIEIGKKCGFDQVYPLDVETLKPMTMVRDACAADKCQAYGKNWTCPPNCGTLEECGARMHSYKWGILLQTVGTMEKRIDTKAYVRIEQEHREHLMAFAEEIRKEYPDALCLGAGGVPGMHPVRLSGRVPLSGKGHVFHGRLRPLCDPGMPGQRSTVLLRA